MDSLLLVISILIASFYFHTLWHRILRKKSRISLRVTTVYIYGFVILLAILLFGESPWLYSSLILYIGCSLLFSFLYLTIFLGGETPSAMILHALSQKKYMSEKEIISLFTEDKLVWKRIADLEESALITSHKDVVSITPKGYYIVRIISVYRRVFHRPIGG